MDLRKILRITIVVHWLSIIVYILVSDILDAYLPVQLQDYKLWVHEQGDTNVETAIMVVATIVGVGHIISSIGLFFLKPWAKWSYSALTASVLILSAFLRPTVEHALTTPFESISTMASGVILYLIFFTNVIPSQINGKQQRSNK